MYIHNCVFRCRFIITITSNEPWNTQTHKMDRNPPITNHKPWPFEPVKVKFCFLRGPLRWLTAVKNAIVSWLLNFRMRMFVESAVVDERAQSIQPKFQLVRPEKVVHLKRWTPFFSKLFRLDRTDPLSFGPKFLEILVEWIAPLDTHQSSQNLCPLWSRKTWSLISFQTLRWVLSNFPIERGLVT